MFNSGMRADAQLDVVGEFLRQWNALPNKQRYQLVPELPIPEMQLAATTHPNPWVRRGCLSFLDHYANDDSIHAFLGALNDPVPFVREMALHGLSCEQCRTAEMCVADVVPVLNRVLAADDSPEVRHKVVPILMNLASRSSSAREALEWSSLSDEDILVRQVATAALEGRVQDARRSRHDLLRRAKTRKGKPSSRPISRAIPQKWARARCRRMEAGGGQVY
jgi:hypothetical protein